MTQSKHAFGYLTQPEIRFLDAAVSRLIPADENGPGAKEADVTYFIDQQLVSVWGMHGRNYRMGPFMEGTPQQGYQSRLVPQEIYRLAISETDAWCSKQFGKPFSLLDAQKQDEVLHQMEEGSIELPSVSSKMFFGLLWRNTQEGFMSDPMYGGNKDKVGWKLIGFPGVAASSYGDELLKHNVPYRVEPVSILDIQTGAAEVDTLGYPRHTRLKDG